MRRVLCNLRLAATAMLIPGLAGVQGCATQQQTSRECASISDAEARISCLDDVMYGSVAEGAAFGAVAGAALGGAVGFATTRSVRGAVNGAVAGGITGGVAVGFAEYLRDLQARTAGDLQRQAQKNAADLASFNEKNALLFSSLISAIKQRNDTETLNLAKTELLRAQQVLEVHIQIAGAVGHNSDTDAELTRARSQIDQLNLEIAEKDRIIQAMPLPEQQL